MFWNRHPEKVVTSRWGHEDERTAWHECRLNDGTIFRYSDPPRYKPEVWLEVRNKYGNTSRYRVTCVEGGQVFGQYVMARTGKGEWYSVSVTGYHEDEQPRPVDIPEDAFLAGPWNVAPSASEAPADQWLDVTTVADRPNRREFNPATRETRITMPPA